MWIKTNPNKERNHKKTNKQNSDHWCKTTVTQKKMIQRRHLVDNDRHDNKKTLQHKVA